MNAFATRGTKLMAPAIVGAASGLALYYDNAPAPTFGTVHAAAKNAVDLKKVKEDIADLIENDAEKRGDGTSLTVGATFCKCLVTHIHFPTYAFRPTFMFPDMIFGFTPLTTTPRELLSVWRGTARVPSARRMEVEVRMVLGCVSIRRQAGAPTLDSALLEML